MAKQAKQLHTHTVFLLLFIFPNIWVFKNEFGRGQLLRAKNSSRRKDVCNSLNSDGEHPKDDNPGNVSSSRTPDLDS